MNARSFFRRFFWFFNRLFMVPMFRLGLGPFVGNPITGYIMVLKTIGHKSARACYTPVNYALLDGQVYCISGWGQRAHWYKNVTANPYVQAILPSAAIQGIVEPVEDYALKLRVIRQIMMNAGFAGFFLGFNPSTVSDAILDSNTRALPVIRIRPTGIGSTASDPGGWMWLVSVGVMMALVLGSKLRAKHSRIRKERAGK